MNIEYIVADLSSVVHYYAKDFQPKSGETLKLSDWFIDTSKGKVIFRIYVDSEETKRTTKPPHR